jgi:hypothetical protein
MLPFIPLTDRLRSGGASAPFVAALAHGAGWVICFAVASTTCNLQICAIDPMSEATCRGAVRGTWKFSAELAAGSAESGEAKSNPIFFLPRVLRVLLNSRGSD